MADLSFRTQAFTHGESIPEKYTCEGDDPHEYRFTLYALADELDVDGGALRPSVQDALDEQTLDSAQFTGTFGRE